MSNNDRHPTDCRCSACAMRRAHARGGAPLGMMEPGNLAKLPKQPPWQWALSYALVAAGDLLIALRERYEGTAEAAPAASATPAEPEPGVRYVDASDPVAAELAAMEAAERGGVQ